MRGGKNLLRKRANLAAAGLTEDQWRERVGGGPAVPDRGRRGGQDAGVTRRSGCDTRSHTVSEYADWRADPCGSAA